MWVSGALVGPAATYQHPHCIRPVHKSRAPLSVHHTTSPAFPSSCLTHATASCLSPTPPVPSPLPSTRNSKLLFEASLSLPFQGAHPSCIGTGPCPRFVPHCSPCGITTLLHGGQGPLQSGSHHHRGTPLPPRLSSRGPASADRRQTQELFFWWRGQTGTQERLNSSRRICGIRSRHFLA